MITRKNRKVGFIVTETNDKDRKKNEREDGRTTMK